MDYESTKRLGLDHMCIDAKNKFETFDPSTNNHAIFIHLLIQDELSCPLCGTINNYIHRK